MAKKEKKDERLDVRLPESTRSRFDEIVGNERGAAVARAREIITDWVEGRLIPAGPLINHEPVTWVPVLGLSYCGNWQEAIADPSESVPVNNTMGRMLDLHDGDVFVEAAGDSMVQAGILDGAFVLMTPLEGPTRARRGEIVLAQVHREGACDSTIKRFNGLNSQGVPVLLDGDDNEVQIPEGTEKIDIVAVGRGSVVRF